MAKRKQSCNRKPFVSDASCDRGNVDTHQFEEFPYCSPIDPGRADIPPMVVAEPIEMELPPPCNCIEIVGGEVKSKKAGDNGGSIGFSAEGDCCNGVYRMGISIPCPIPEVKKTTVKGRVKFVPQDVPPPPLSYTLFSPASSACVMPQPKSIDMEMNLPCPIKLVGDGKVKLSTVFRKNPKPQSFVIGKGDTIGCTLKIPQQQNIELGVPCPIPNGTGKMRASIKYGNGFNVVSAPYLNGNADNCTLEYPNKQPSLALEIPNPIIGTKSGAVSVKIRCGSAVLASASGSLVTVKTNANAGKQIEMKTANLDLQLKCPVRKVGDPTIGITLKQGNRELVKERKRFMTIDETNCDVTANSVSFKLEVPCCARQAGNHSIKVKYTTGGTQHEVEEQYAVTGTGDDCYVDLQNPELDLGEIGGGGGGGLVPGSYTTGKFFLTAASYGEFDSSYKFRFTKSAIKIIWSATGITGVEVVGSPSYTYVGTIPITEALPNS